MSKAHGKYMFLLYSNSSEKTIKMLASGGFEANFGIFYEIYVLTPFQGIFAEWSQYMMCLENIDKIFHNYFQNPISSLKKSCSLFLDFTNHLC